MLGDPATCAGRLGEVTRALTTQLLRLQLQLAQGADLDAAQMNAKFADSMFEGAYGDLQEHVDGAVKTIELPALQILDGMRLQCCDAADFQEAFQVPNNGVEKARPAKSSFCLSTSELSTVSQANAGETIGANLPIGLRGRPEEVFPAQPARTFLG